MSKRRRGRQQRRPQPVPAVDGMIRGYGSRAAAIDELTKELAAAVLAEGEEQP